MSGSRMKDIMEEFVWESLTGGTGLDVKHIVIILAASCLAGVYIFLIYKGFSKSAFYSKDLNVTMAGMCIVVAAIMIAMQSNLLVSLGMVGALSIVRFRTAVKNPIDLLYLFWSISAGIICGVGLYMLAAVLCIIMTAAIWLMGRIPAAKAPKVLIIRCDSAADAQAMEDIIKSRTAYMHLSSASTRGGSKEIIYEVRVKSPAEQIKLIDELQDMEGIHGVSCLEHDGEVRG